MAFPIFDNGAFQVTALSFSPSLVAINESASMSITIKNTSGKNISACSVEQDGSYPTADFYEGFPSQFLYGNASSLQAISWPNNTSKTFTATVSFSAGPNLDTTNYVLVGYPTEIDIQILTNVIFSDYSNVSNLRIMSGDGYFTVLSKRDNPRLTLDIERTPNDESIAVKTTSKLTASSTLAEMQAHGYSINLYASDSNNPASSADTPITFNATLAELMAGIVGSTTAITETFSNTTNWYFLLTVSNGYESASVYGNISRAFANVHMSGASTGGVAFGKFSSATEGNPLFECVYPAVFSGNVTVPVEGLLKTVKVTVASAEAVEGGATASYTVPVNAGDGWTPIGIVGYSANSRWVMMIRSYLDDNGEAACTVYNHGTPSRNVTIIMYVLCLRTG